MGFGTNLLERKDIRKDEKKKGLWLVLIIVSAIKNTRNRRPSAPKAVLYAFVTYAFAVCNKYSL